MLLKFEDRFDMPYFSSDESDLASKRIDQKPNGKIFIHMCGNPSFEMDYYENETVKDLRKRIGEFTETDVSNFNLASKNGTMYDAKKLKEYEVQPQSHIIVFEKYADKSKMLETRHRWLECRERRSFGAININTDFLNDLSPKQNIRLNLKDQPKDLHLYKSVETFFDEIPKEIFN